MMIPPLEFIIMIIASILLLSVLLGVVYSTINQVNIKMRNFLDTDSEYKVYSDKIRTLTYFGVSIIILIILGLVILFNNTIDVLYTDCINGLRIREFNNPFIVILG